MKTCILDSDSPSLPPSQAERRQCGCGQCIADLLGTPEVPALSSGCPTLCEGCGEPKLYRGREASSQMCCRACWKKLPKWMREASMNNGGMLWENRIAVTLLWMREASTAPIKLGQNVGTDGTDHSHADTCFNDPPDDWICTGCEERAEEWERPHEDGESECGHCGNREWRRPTAEEIAANS